MAETQPSKDRPRRRALARPPTGEARFSGLEGESASDRLYWQLHRSIVQLDLRPGTAISEPRLAAEFGMSRTPVREAIQRLAKDKLVEIVPKSGTFVGRIPISTLLDSWVIRRTLETEMIRLAIPKLTADVIDSMYRLVQEQQQACEREDLRLFHHKDEEFHQSFCLAAGYPRIWDHIRQVKVQIDRYRRLTLPTEGRLEKIVVEHRTIVDEMAKGNTAMAGAALHYHLGKLQFDLHEYHGEWPDYFIYDAKIGTGWS